MTGLHITLTCMHKNTKVAIMPLTSVSSICSHCLGSFSAPKKATRSKVVLARKTVNVHLQLHRPHGWVEVEQTTLHRKRDGGEGLTGACVGVTV